jgi:hypothetical protein
MERAGRCCPAAGQGVLGRRLLRALRVRSSQRDYLRSHVVIKRQQIAVLPTALYALTFDDLRSSAHYPELHFRANLAYLASMPTLPVPI